MNETEITIDGQSIGEVCVVYMTTPKPLTEGHRRMLSQRANKRRAVTLQHNWGEPIRTAER
jgi:hypothetical protein